MQNQLVTAFVSDVATDLPKYGLDQAAGEGGVFLLRKARTRRRRRQARKPLETILFGKVDGDNVYAKLDDEPFIVSVPKSILEGIYKDPLKWQDLTIYKLNPDDIVGLDVTRDGQAMLSMVKEKGQWKPAKGDIALNTGNIEDRWWARSLHCALCQWAGRDEAGARAGQARR